MSNRSLLSISFAIIILICVLTSCGQHTVYVETENYTTAEITEEVYTVLATEAETLIGHEEDTSTVTTLSVTERATETKSTTTPRFNTEPSTTHKIEQKTESVITRANEPITQSTVTTRAAETTTQKPITTTQPTTKAQEIDIDFYINYAISYGKSIGLTYTNDARDCWDTPLGVRSTNHDAVIRDIKDRLDGYRYHDGDEYFCVWAEKRSDGNYNLFIGYA